MSAYSDWKNDKVTKALYSALVKARVYYVNHLLTLKNIPSFEREYGRTVGAVEQIDLILNESWRDDEQVRESDN